MQRGSFKHFDSDLLSNRCLHVGTNRRQNGALVVGNCPYGAIAKQFKLKTVLHLQWSNAILYYIGAAYCASQILIQWEKDSRSKGLHKTRGSKLQRTLCIFYNAPSIGKSKAIDHKKTLVITNTLKCNIRLEGDFLTAILWCSRDNSFFGVPWMEVNWYGYSNCNYHYHYQLLIQ